MWQHPDWTARELTELLPRHSAKAITIARQRHGRYLRSVIPLCCKCSERPVWAESQAAKRYGLCKGCYLDEERMRLEEEAKHVALRQRAKRLREKKRAAGLD